MHLNQFQKQIVQMLFAMIILVIASLIRIIRPENLYWNIVLFLLVYIIYISMAVVWLLSLHHRIMQKNLRRHLIGTAVLICFGSCFGLSGIGCYGMELSADMHGTDIISQ